MKKITQCIDVLQRIVASRKFRIFVLALFVVQAIFLVFATHMGVPPDEKNHVDFIEYYADHSPSPIFSHQTPTYNLGDKTREVDYIYHFVMSWVMRLLPFSHHVDLYIIRLLSVGFALLTFLLLLRILKHLGVGKAESNLGLLAVTNIPMVLMMSSAVNNDVLVWLGLVAGIYFLIRLWKYHMPVDVLLLLIIAIYGGITKRTLFPICLILGVVTLVMVVKYWQQLREHTKLNDWRLIALSVVLVIGVGLFAERVGGNLYRYHTITPSCTQVQGENACKVFWQYQRKADLDDNSQMSTQQWLYGGAIKDTAVKPIPVFAASWAVYSYNNIVDIQTDGWHHDAKPPIWLGTALLLATFVTTVAGLIYDARRVRRDTNARWRLVAIGFSVIVIVGEFFINYSTYLNSHVFRLALNGRYILPAVILMAGFNVFYGRRLFGRTVGTILMIILLVGIIFGSGLVMMMRNPQLFAGK